MNMRVSDLVFGAIVLACISILVYGLGWLIFVKWPTYSVWSAEMGGRAVMARAEQDRQVRVRDAEAKRDASRLDAESEVIRAEGVAKANAILAGGLGGPDGYLKYLYIQQLGNADKNERTVIYVPTDGLIPQTEAGRALRK